jgi:hypothetical protein
MNKFLAVVAATLQIAIAPAARGAVTWDFIVNSCTFGDGVTSCSFLDGTSIATMVIDQPIGSGTASWDNFPPAPQPPTITGDPNFDFASPSLAFPFRRPVMSYAGVSLRPRAFMIWSGMRPPLASTSISSHKTRGLVSVSQGIHSDRQVVCFLALSAPSTVVMIAQSLGAMSLVLGSPMCQYTSRCRR